MDWLFRVLVFWCFGVWCLVFGVWLFGCLIGFGRVTGAWVWEFQRKNEKTKKPASSGDSIFSEPRAPMVRAIAHPGPGTRQDGNVLGVLLALVFVPAG
jgi:hypothetical protein